MKIATWNINSIKVRLPAVTQYILETSPDVLALQETKSIDENFPKEEIEKLGYKCFFTGQKTYNGVATIFRNAPSNIIVLGDFNIAPTDADVFDVEATHNQILCSPKERDFIDRLKKIGLNDLFLKFDHPEKTFSWWDYRGGAFHKNIGYRIDLILGTTDIYERTKDVFVDKHTRHKKWCKKEPRTSDHAPVVAIVDS